MRIQESSYAEADNSQLRIYTLGRFNVQRNDRIITDSSNRSSKMWDLFKYVITNRKKRINCEVFINILWTEDECSNPAKALHTLIYRLKLMLRDPKTPNKDNIINFLQGGYSWNPHTNYWLDAEEFEKLCHKAYEADKINSSEALYLYSQAFSLYMGEHLPEYSYNEWVIPIRNYYKRIYIEMTLKYIELLKKSGMEREVIGTCETALLIEPYDESLNLCFIETLIELKQTKQAQDHYEFITSILYKELGIKPSHNFTNLYHRIKSCTENNKIENINVEMDKIQKMLVDNHEQMGAFLCDFDCFKSIYNIERQRMSRAEQKFFLVLFTFNDMNFSQSEFSIDNSLMALIQESIKINFRKGDIISQISRRQLICMLPCINIEHVEKVVKRIVYKFKLSFNYRDITIKTRIQAMLPSDIYIINKHKLI